MSAENAHTWTIPLTVSVSLGAETAPGAAKEVPGDAKEEPGAGKRGATEKLSPTQQAKRARGDEFSEWWIFGGRKAAPPDVFGGASSRFSLEALDDDIFNWQGALNAALCSWIAYEPAAKVGATVKGKWGFETCDFVAQDDTECFVASTPKAIVVSFRGTQEARDWLINLNLSTKRASYGYVHRGFYNAFHSVRLRLEQLLGDHGAQSKKVVLSGHSLGGATATIAAAEWRGKYPISGVFTFGQPAVGFTAFRSYISMRFGNSFRRFVNDDDIVPKVPPGYRHAGKLYHFDSGTGISHERFGAESIAADDTPTMTVAEFELFKARLRAAGPIGQAGTQEQAGARAFQEGFFPSFADHSMDRYLEKILAQM